MLVHAKDADDGTRMTARQVRDEVMTIFMAGHETTAVALSWTWYLLAQHPDADARLPRYAYFPFGGGPRQCIGNGFAPMEAVLVLAAIARRFRLSLVPGQQITPTPTSRCGRCPASACFSFDADDGNLGPYPY